MKENSVDTTSVLYHQYPVPNTIPNLDNSRAGDISDIDEPLGSSRSSAAAAAASDYDYDSPIAGAAAAAASSFDDDFSDGSRSGK